MRHALAWTVALVLLTVLPALGHAQLEMGAQAGVAFPGGALEEFGTGIHLQGSLSYHTRMAFDVRADAVYQRLPGREAWAGRPYHSAGVVLNAVVDALMPPIQPSHPYLLAGLGVFHHRVEGGELDDGTDFGLSGGGGVRIPIGGMSLLVELRYQYVFAGERRHTMTPLTIGVAF